MRPLVHTSIDPQGRSVLMTGSFVDPGLNMKQSSGKPESMDASKKPRSDGLPSARRAKSQLSPPPILKHPHF